MTRPRAVSPTALPRRIAQCMALVIIGTLTVLGCGKSSSSDTPATASDLTNRSFAFTSGAGPDLAKELKLPQGQAFTLQFGNFGGTNVGPVTLDSGGSAASGTVSLASGSCIFHFDRSTFPAGGGPQSDEQLTPNACQINKTDTTLRLTAASGENRVSAPAIPLPMTNVALVLTTDAAIGSYSVVDLALRSVFKDIKVGGVHSDAIARFVRTADFVNPSAFPSGRVYVVNRLGADSIQIL